MLTRHLPCTDKLKHLYPLVIGIRDEDVVVAVDGKPRGQPELPGADPLLPKTKEELSLRVKDLHNIEERIHDVNVAQAIHSNSLRS